MKFQTLMHLDIHKFLS